MKQESAIVTREISKLYGEVVAVEKLELDIKKGECLALLGPNGAGKTTTLEILEGITYPTTGSVRIFGIDPFSSCESLKQRIGVQLQESHFFEFLKVKEICHFFACFYNEHLPLENILSCVDLSSKIDARVRNLSGGQRQRLSLALAFINDPDILFLDEPTQGLDPQSRRQIWQMLQQAKQKGKTIVLSTHDMKEAEILSDRIAIMYQGKVLALGNHKDLILQHKGTIEEGSLECLYLELTRDITVT